MSRERMLATIDAIYAERIAGLTDTMAAHLAPGATLYMAGEGQMAAAFGAPGPADFLAALATLNTAIAMKQVTRLTALAEGRRCAVLLKATVQFYDREPFETEIFNLWSFDEAGKVAEVGQEVRACALGQASASLMGQAVIGKTVGELEEARDALTAYLAGKREDPGDWPGLDIFAPARAHSARHASIRLAFEAAAEAARIAQSR